MVGVRFRPSERVAYCDAGDLALEVGDRVVVSTDDGEMEGRIVISADQVLFSDLRGPLLPVLRRAPAEA